MSRFQSTIGRRKLCPVPGIYWHESSRQFVSQVGFHEVQSMDRKGRIRSRRIRSSQTLGNNEAHAVLRFYELKQEWETIKREFRRQRKSAGALDRFVSLPVWPKPEHGSNGHAESAATASIIPVISQPLQPPPVINSATIGLTTANQAPTPTNGNGSRLYIPAAAHLTLTIRQAKDRFLEIYRSRIGKIGGRGISENTFFKYSQNLELALGLNKNYARKSKPINVNRVMASLRYEDYKDFTDFWTDPTNVTSERTSINYIGAFKRMLDGLKIRVPEECEELFRLRVTALPKIVKYNPAWLRALLSFPDDRARMFQLMGLNFGSYQCDIVRLTQSHITDYDGLPYQSGEMFVTRRRERTRHRNNFATTVYVWPETQQLMEKFRAKANPADAYFLSKFGLPYDEDTISYFIAPAIHAAGLQGQFSFKQWRKIGASQIKAIGGSDAMHQYKANALSAADQPYILEDYAILTRALKAFREKLIADEVFPS